jgi:hypothetical protein
MENSERTTLYWVKEQEIYRKLCEATFSANCLSGVHTFLSNNRNPFALF